MKWKPINGSKQMNNFGGRWGGESDLFDLILYVSVNNFFVYVGLGFHGLNQYLARIDVSCSRTQHNDDSEARTCNPSVWSEALYH